MHIPGLVCGLKVILKNHWFDKFSVRENTCHIFMSKYFNNFRSRKLRNVKWIPLLKFCLTEKLIIVMKSCLSIGRSQQLLLWLDLVIKDFEWNALSMTLKQVIVVKPCYFQQWDISRFNQLVQRKNQISDFVPGVYSTGQSGNIIKVKTKWLISFLGY